MAAGVGLGMKTPVRRVCIFPCTILTQRKCRHAGAFAVIGQGFNDAEPGTAVGAIDKGIPIAPVARVKQLRQTVRTGGCIRQDGTRLIARLRYLNDKTLTDIGHTVGTQRLNVDMINRSQWREALQQSLLKPAKVRLGAYQPHLYPCGRVEYLPPQAKGCSQVPDMGTKAHPLHSPLNDDPVTRHLAAHSRFTP